MKRFPGNGKRVRSELGIAHRVPLVGFVGRLEEIKGPHLFIEAAMEIGNTLPQTHFLVVGDGPMKAELMKKTKGTLHCHFVGHREDIPDIMAALDLLLIPSLNDGFNLAAVEAMASAKPIIATAVGGLPEVVGKGGILVKSEDVRGLAQEAIKVINEPDLKKKLGAQGRKRAEILFDWNVCLQRTLDIYRQVVGKK